MNPVELLDDYGRQTSFVGERLSLQHTDTERPKPRYTQIEVWRTQGGWYIVSRKTVYRIRHLDPTCGYRHHNGSVERLAEETDDFPCATCNPDGVLEEGWGQVSQTNVTVCATAQLLIDNLAAAGGGHSPFSQAILADVSEQDPAVAALWMTRKIP